MQTISETRLPRSTPETQGISSVAISNFLAGVEKEGLEFHSFMLLRHGHVVAEGWWKPYSTDRVHLLYSVSKSFTSTAIGFAIDEGLLSEDDFVTSFFPDDLPETISEHLAAMRVRHVLSMATGHKVDTLNRMFEISEDWTKAFLSLPPEQAPGSIFCYNNGATYLLSAIIQKVTGMKLLNYLRPRLLEPLGITQARWDENARGINYGFSGLHVTTETIAKLGQLYLQKGVWQGKRLLSEKWIETATREHIPNASETEVKTTDWEQGYGYQFWRCQHDAYRADGAFGQFCVVMPKQDAVLAITSAVESMQAVLDLTYQHLLPALEDKPLPESSARLALEQQLASLSIPPVTGNAHSEIAREVSSKSYHFDVTGQPQGRFEETIQSVSLNFHDNEWLLNIQTLRNEHQFNSAYNQWTSGKTAFYGEPSSDVEVSGAWTDANTFTVQITYIETPHCLTMRFCFDRKNLTLKRKWNVSFGPLELPVLRGNK
jgi:CubicO group peptidase (beta-lactamase class C family)